MCVATRSKLPSKRVYRPLYAVNSHSQRLPDVATDTDTVILRATEIGRPVLQHVEHHDERDGGHMRAAVLDVIKLIELELAE
jgi:hypothetical protein